MVMIKRNVNKIFKARLLAILSLFISMYSMNCSNNSNNAVTVSSGNGGVVTSNPGNGNNSTTPPGATLSIPAGALDADTNITITSSPKMNPQGDIIPINATYNFSPEGLEFNEPANLEICYDPQELVASGLLEETVEVYYLDPSSGAYANIGGDVDAQSHCVNAQVGHFSTYLIAARALTSSLPFINAPNFMPAQPNVLAGIPLLVRTIIRSQQTPAVDATTQAGTGSIVWANLYYRITGSGAAFNQIPMSPDYANTAGEFYHVYIPAASVTTAGIDYYFDAMDNLGQISSTTPTSITPANIKTANLAGSLQVTPSPINITAGFNRKFTVKAPDSGGGLRNVFPSVYTVSGGTITPVSTGTSGQLQFTANTIGAGTLNVSYGTLQGSPTITVHSGAMTSLAILDKNTGIPITSALKINSGNTFDFDVVGYDIFNNSIEIIPNFTITGGIGTIDSANGQFTAVLTSIPLSGSLTADLGVFTSSVPVDIIAFPLATPVFNPPSATYTSIQNVTITSDAGSNICYDATGAVPACNTAKTGCSTGSLYTAPVTVSASSTLKAIACEPGYQDSIVATGLYTIDLPPAATPTFNPPGGTYNTDQYVMLSTATAGATIYYTTDGSIPTTASDVYTEVFSPDCGPILAVCGSVPPIMGNGTTVTIKAMAVSNSMANSAIATATYTIDYRVPPTITYPGSTYTFSQNSVIPKITPALTPALTGNVPTICSILPTLPTGLILDAATCEISGTPTTLQGSTTYTITGSNIYGDGFTSITLSVTQPVGTQDALSLGPIALNMRFIPGKITYTGVADDTQVSVTNSYTIAETEVTYDLWSTVYNWAIANGYSFVNVGHQGFDGFSNCFGPSVGTIYNPATCMNWRDAIVWCNALTEYYNVQNATSLAAVYTSDSSYTIPIKSSINPAYVYGLNYNPGSFDFPYVNPDAKGFRLPTDAEWELAARYISDLNNDGDILDINEYYPGSHISGDSTADYMNSLVLDLYVWYPLNSGFMTSDVATKTANPMGLFDMSGNVPEWNYDWPPVQPDGTLDIDHRYYRGGSAFDSIETAESSQVGLQFLELPYRVPAGIGLRLARTP